MTSPNQRIFQTIRVLNPAGDPQEYVDVALPTVSVKFRGPIRRGAVRAPRGSILGSYRISGTHYDNAPGTYSLRISRVSLFSGSRGQRWVIQHSRVGTVDIQHFINAGQVSLLGAGNEPVYVLGPGTVTWGFIGVNASGSMGSAYFTSQFLEGYLNA